MSEWAGSGKPLGEGGEKEAGERGEKGRGGEYGRV